MSQESSNDYIYISCFRKNIVGYPKHSKFAKTTVLSNFRLLDYLLTSAEIIAAVEQNTSIQKKKKKLNRYSKKICLVLLGKSLRENL